MKNYELIELSIEEQFQIDGGLLSPGVPYLFVQAMDFWGAFSSGFNDAYQNATR